MVKVIELINTMSRDPNIVKLMREMLTGSLLEIKPTIDMSTEIGCNYHAVEKLLGVSTAELITMLESLAGENVIEKHFHDKILFCPHCKSPNLRPGLRCPKCGSGNIAKGRVLEHFSCAYIGLEDTYMAAGKYICPKCKKELRFLGTDYRSLGVNYQCYNCNEIFTEATLKWQCLRCLIFFAEGETKEVNLYSYRLNEKERLWLEFELGPKTQFIEFLKNQGYTVTESAIVDSVSKSGAGHILDVMAQRDDGFISYTIGIGIAIDGNGNDISLEEVFRFDDKVYDLGIHDKVLLVLPRLGHEAKQFADRQRIRTFEGKELESFLASVNASAGRETKAEPFEFETKAKLVKHLEKLGYKVHENAKAQGRSGAEHTLDIMAYNDDGFITHTLGIGIIAAKDMVSLDAVASFDTRAYDVGIHDKALVVSPGLTQEAKQFAQQQRIKVIETDTLS